MNQTSRHAFVAGVILMFGVATQGAEVYVSPGGGDAQPGTRAAPMATFEAARDALRRAGTEPRRLVVLPGDYFLTQPLTLDTHDNGLTIESETNGVARLYCGKTVTGWRRDGDRFWCADVSEVKAGTWDFRTLIVNGRWADRARYPETNTLNHLRKCTTKSVPMALSHLRPKPPDEEMLNMPYRTNDIPATLDIRNAEVLVYHMWNASVLGVASNDLQNYALIFSNKPQKPLGQYRVMKYAILNTVEGMARPGQWYLDRTAGRVVYWPLPDEDMTKAKVIAPVDEHVVVMLGKSKTAPIQDVTIRGLAIHSTSVPFTKVGNFAGASLPGALNVRYATNCVFEGLEISKVGGIGIVALDLEACRFSGCEVHHTAACGMQISGNDTVIEKNHVHHVGLLYLGSAAGVINGDRWRLYRNELHDAPYCGVTVRGSDNLVEENLIYRVMQAVHDGAAIYGSMQRSIIRGNMVKEVENVGDGFGAFAYYLDERSRDCVIERNVAYNVSKPFHNHISYNITLRDNVFISEKDMLGTFTRSSKCVFERNTLFYPGKLTISYPHGARLWTNNITFRGGVDAQGNTQPFLIGDYCPADTPQKRQEKPVDVPRVVQAPTIDGETLPADEWQCQSVALSRQPSRLRACGSPVLAAFAYDDRNVYVSVTVTMIWPVTISEGSTWGKDDGMELCLAGVSSDGKPVTFVLRGYPNGTLQSATDAGASAEEATRFGKTVRYATKHLPGPRGWVGEWAIPFSALGLNPAPSMKIPFNAAVYNGEMREWFCLEGTLAENWRLDQAAVLLLSSKP